MAITFSQKIRMSMGDKKFRVYQITGDASTTSITAANLDMNYIDYALLSPAKGALSSGVYDDHNFLSVAGGTTIIGLADAGTSGAIWDLQAWGW
jgi:hypothetical protein